MAQKKYVSLSKLSTFLDNLKNTFASSSHKHTILDITDYKVDTSLSSTSTNPVQNKVLDAEFDAISTAMNALESVVDGKASTSHGHAVADITNLQTTLDSKINADQVYTKADHKWTMIYDSGEITESVNAIANID